MRGRATPPYWPFVVPRGNSNPEVSPGASGRRGVVVAALVRRKAVTRGTEVPPVGNACLWLL